MNKQTIITLLFSLVSLASLAQGNNYTINGTVNNPDVTVVYLPTHANNSNRDMKVFFM